MDLGLYFVVNFLVVGVASIGVDKLHPLHRARSELLDRLFDPNVYDKELAPVTKDNAPVNVLLSGIIFSFNGVDEEHGFANMDSGVVMRWADFRIGYNKSMYGNFITIEPDVVWRVQVVPLAKSNVELGSSDSSTFLSAYINWKGDVYFIYTLDIKPTCTFDVYNYPYDKATCTSLFVLEGSTENIATRAMLKTSRAQYVNVVCDWDITEITHLTLVNKSQAGQGRGMNYEWTIKLERQSKYLVYAHVIPVVIAAMAVPIQYLMEPGSSERFLTGGALLVAMSFLISSLLNSLPRGYLVVPRLAIYYGLTFIWIVVSLLVTCVTASLSQNNFAGQPVPYGLRKLFLVHLKTLFCFGGDSDPTMDPISVRKFEQQHRARYNEATNAFEKPMLRNRFENNVDTIRKAVKTIRAIQDLKQSRDQNRREWHQVALIIDRLCFLVFSSIYVIYSVSLL